MSSLEMASGQNSTSVSVARSRLAEGLWHGAMGTLAVLPIGMAIAHRSSLFFLVLSALCAIGASALEGRLRPFLQEVRAALMTPLGLAILAFLAWCAVSIGWSEFRGVSARSFGEFALPIVASFVLSLALPPRMISRAFWLLVAAFVVASLMMLFEIHYGLFVRQALGMRAVTFIFNRPTITLLLLTAPLVAWFTGTVRRGLAGALLITVLALVMALESDSGAAVLGFAVAALVFPVAWFVPRVAKMLSVIAFVAAIGAAPFIGTLTDRIIPASLHQKMAQGHSRARVDIWASFGAVVQERLLVGAGFGVSPRMQETTIASRVPTQHRTLLAVGHPHNAALQIWAELGAVGAGLALAVILLTVGAVARQAPLVRSLSLSLIAGAATIAYIGHGAWQGWWAASLGAAVVWMLAAKRMRPETR